MNKIVVILAALLLVGCASKTTQPPGPTIAQQLAMMEKQIEASMTS